jgi:predicted metalloprotease
MFLKQKLMEGRAMTLYVVEIHYDPHESNLCGVFSSVENAKAACEFDRANRSCSEPIEWSNINADCLRGVSESYVWTIAEAEQDKWLL